MRTQANKRLELPAGAASMGEDPKRRAGRPPQLTRSVSRIVEGDVGS